VSSALAILAYHKLELPLLRYLHSAVKSLAQNQAQPIPAVDAPTR
jgi:hypothetical protein